MDNKILGFNTDTFYALVLLLLLIILGIVSFNYYVQFSGKNGIKFDTGVGVQILPGRQSGQGQPEEGMY